ncbi:3-isopropylmalate dehydratase large subunit [Candidatus Epulonipiscium fishelsonii]|uniref:3-isopropylmalate dehydratase large subunit n=1 Tax=Candidatus Epulonipiscium fishelsonii TaxID=77094 RepID=A0ACC8XIW1_9FIRM|nr:3-isopropylmalate dehydratase large subunit [Epulopiscium sp. SCG-D08WGA-EpuloA1]
MHALEKILASHAGVDTLQTGEILNCDIDIAGANDLYLQSVYSFYEMGGEQVTNPDNIVFFMDHYAPASSKKQALNQKEFREFAAKQGIEKLMDIDEGVCHQVLVDRGLSKPGTIIVITDSHTTMHGAFGAFSTGVGATDHAIIMKTGKLWFRVPKIVKIELNGKLAKGVYAKDIILDVIGKLGADYAVYKAVEFSGSLIAELSMSERLAICNMTTEMGAKASYIQPDKVTLDYLLNLGVTDFTVYETDEGYEYEEVVTFDVSDIQPTIAVPFSVDNVDELEAYIGTPINQVFLGTCTGGRIEDLEVAAKILAGKKVKKGTRMLVIPASKKVLQEAITKGYMSTLVEAGATFVTPGCAACLGTHQGIITDGEACVSSASRNFPGRMGATQAKIYLASPAVVAASAIEGKLADPRKYMEV